MWGRALPSTTNVKRVGASFSSFLDGLGRHIPGPNHSLLPGILNLVGGCQGSGPVRDDASAGLWQPVPRNSSTQLHGAKCQKPTSWRWHPKQVCFPGINLALPPQLNSFLGAQGLAWFSSIINDFVNYPVLLLPVDWILCLLHPPQVDMLKPNPQ